MQQGVDRASDEVDAAGLRICRRDAAELLDEIRHVHDRSRQTYLRREAIDGSLDVSRRYGRDDRPELPTLDGPATNGAVLCRLLIGGSTRGVLSHVQGLCR